MNKIRGLDKGSGALVCDSGCVLEELNNYVSDYGLMMPLDLAAKGSCQISGIVSTNAGGIRFLKYGSLHGNILGLEIVSLNSTGYDIKQLFIGTDGTLGIVTGVSILTVRKLEDISVVVLGFNSFDNVRKTALSSKEQLAEILSVPDLKKRLSEAGIYDDAKSGQINPNKVNLIAGYGHIGDGNIHLSVMSEKMQHKLTNLLEPYIFEWIYNVGGSVSAEHGLGLNRRDCLHYSKSQEFIAMMRKVKSVFDPKGIMNPCKFIPLG
ncbi:hypothetical protein BB560_000597 [Smittium megazygosporum]|uniref:FAD-binding PCMH-type domain-containing protein n=1 Tax=Smittium megazygosporum TaxID=133381 RepID=A0A2T9ZK41_9FUNG|nr:hypothetical protein BB560_000597 [Smittium megazygosporum]